jgi:hypothetical protein
MEVRMELSRILITDYGGKQVIYLTEPASGRSFPIEIGTMEAYAIDRRLKGIPTPRPMTHDLLANVMEALGGTIEKIVITEIRYDPQDGSGTFIATLHVRRDDQVITIDSRPSDAIALGAAYDTPIFVDERVIDDVTASPSPQERVMILRKRMEVLSEQIEAYAVRVEDKEFFARTASQLLQDLRHQLELMKKEYEAIRYVLQKLT